VSNDDGAELNNVKLENAGGAESAAGVLIVGYGNPLRSDDGLGWHAAELLARDPRLRAAQVLWQHQLTPELALDFSQATLVVLIDASAEEAPGVISVRRLDAPVGRGSGSASTHHTDPASLVALARELWGTAPDVFIVSVGAESLEVSEALSPVVQAALPGVVEAVVGILTKPADATRLDDV
jgi:hydrogenase maturation protease